MGSYACVQKQRISGCCKDRFKMLSVILESLAVMFSETHGYNKTPAWISEVCKGAYVVILTVTTYDTTLVHREDLV